MEKRGIEGDQPNWVTGILQSSEPVPNLSMADMGVGGTLAFAHPPASPDSILRTTPERIRLSVPVSMPSAVKPPTAARVLMRG